MAACKAADRYGNGSTIRVMSMPASRPFPTIIIPGHGLTASTTRYAASALIRKLLSSGQASVIFIIPTSGIFSPACAWLWLYNLLLYLCRQALDDHVGITDDTDNLASLDQASA